jgi:outer membrane protein assembly factor BamE
MRRLLPLLFLLAAAAASSGCVYRPNIQQGNLLKIEDVDQVTAGMTRSQVRYLLGTPMVSDPFHPDRWDYVFSFKRGRERKADTAHFVVALRPDKVSRVEAHSPTALPTVESVDAPEAPAAEAEREPPRLLLGSSSPSLKRLARRFVSSPQRPRAGPPRPIVSPCAASLRLISRGSALSAR